MTFLAQRDSIHDAVANALIKDGWTITADPLFLRYGGIEGQIDLEAEKPLETEKPKRTAAFEIKTFSAKSDTYTFGHAMGQYLLYCDLIEFTGNTHEVYLVITEDVYQKFFQLPGIRAVVNKRRIALSVVRIATEEIVQWIEPQPQN
jgi:hypothetical protein